MRNQKITTILSDEIKTAVQDIIRAESKFQPAVDPSDSSPTFFVIKHQGHEVVFYGPRYSSIFDMQRCLEKELNSFLEDLGMDDLSVNDIQQVLNPINDQTIITELGLKISNSINLYGD